MYDDAAVLPFAGSLAVTGMMIDVQWLLLASVALALMGLLVIRWASRHRGPTRTTSASDASEPHGRAQ
jgi:hypothetical protein